MKKRFKAHEVCELGDSLDELKVDPFVMVIFGGSGDLSRRKLIPALYRLFASGTIESFSIIALGRSSLNDDKYRSMLKKWCKKALAKEFGSNKWKRFAAKISYKKYEINDPETYVELCGLSTELVKEHKARSLVYYLAVPPSAAPEIVKNLEKRDMCRGKKEARIIVEKPFGEDQKSAHELNQLLLNAFYEKQIYRIDHFLGKETVQNILFFRFANTILEPIWNRDYIDYITITVAEKLGVEKRGAFYEEAGVIRDMVQNHMLQLLAMIAMEPPAGFEADLIRDEKVKVFRAVRNMTGRDIGKNTVVAQYGAGRVDGRKAISYHNEKSVSRHSVTPTYIEGKFYIDNWRWSDVPFYFKTGKRLSDRFTEIKIFFKKPPLKLIGSICDEMPPNMLTITIQPKERIAFTFGVKRPKTLSHPHQVEMVFNYSDAFGYNHYSPYERLLLDCVRGDQTLFTRQDEVEMTWSIVDPIISYWDKKLTKANLLIYKAGSFPEFLNPQEKKK